MSARRIVFVLLSLALWLGALTGIPSDPAVEMRWAEAAVDRAALVRALDQAEHPVSAAVWGMRRVEGRTVAVYSGDPLLLTGGRMLDGSAAVCAVSESTARGIWGAVDVEGLTLRLGGKDYVVGGVYPVGVADVLIAWDGASEVSFRHMAVRFPDQVGGAHYGKALDFASRAGMSAPDEVLDAPLLYDMARMAAQLPGLALIMLVIAWQWRALRGVRMMGVPPRIPVIVLSLAGMALALGISLAPPKWLLPTRWSDFAHWETLLHEVGGRLADFMRAAHNPLNAGDLNACMRASAQGILAAALLYDIRGGRNNAQNMDRPGARRYAMLWRRRGNRRVGAGGSNTDAISGDIGAARGTGV